MDDETTKLIEALSARVAALEQDVGDRHNLIEQGFNQRIDAMALQVETLSQKVDEWVGQQGSNHLHLNSAIGDLAVRVHALEPAE